MFEKTFINASRTLHYANVEQLLLLGADLLQKILQYPSTVGISGHSRTPMSVLRTMIKPNEGSPPCNSAGVERPF